MASISKNVLANAIGGTWLSLVGIIFAPLYLKYVGAEGYAVIGLFATLLSIAGLAEFGLAGTLQRELARLSAQASPEKQMRDVLKTLGTSYWLITAIITALLYFSSDVVASKWFLGAGSQNELLGQELQLASITVGLQLLIVFYHGGVMSLQYQVLANVVMSFFVTVRAVGAVFVLWKVSPDVITFFYWQILISLFHLLTVQRILWHKLGEGFRSAKFSGALVRQLWRFSGGVYLIGITAVLITQIDKIAISRYVTLEGVGYYMLATTIVLGITKLVTHMLTAVYPRLVQLVELGEDAQLRGLYHKATQLVVTFVAPVLISVVFFSKELVLLWTGDALVSNKVSQILPFLMLGSAINALMIVPYYVQLAYGWTRLALYTNIALLVMFVPAMFYLVALHGVVAAAWLWAAINMVYIFVHLPIMHYKVLRGELVKWYLADIAPPIIIGGALMFVLKSMYQPDWHFLVRLMYILAAAGAVTLLSAFSLTHVREKLLKIVRLAPT